MNRGSPSTVRPLRVIRDLMRDRVVRACASHLPMSICGVVDRLRPGLNGTGARLFDAAGGRAAVCAVAAPPNQSLRSREGLTGASEPRTSLLATRLVGACRRERVTDAMSAMPRTKPPMLGGARPRSCAAIGVAR